MFLATLTNAPAVDGGLSLAWLAVLVVYVIAVDVEPPVVREGEGALHGLEEEFLSVFDNV